MQPTPPQTKQTFIEEETIAPPQSSSKKKAQENSGKVNEIAEKWRSEREWYPSDHSLWQEK